MKTTKRTEGNPSTEYDTKDSSSFSSLYEITAKTEDGVESVRCVLEACRESEAREIFRSLPEISGMGFEVTEVKRIMHGVYWVRG